MHYYTLIPRRYLFMIGGIVWTLVGMSLCYRAISWLAQMNLKQEILIESGALACSIVCYFYGFARIVNKNLARIHSLPEKASFFAFTALRGYILIAMMITIGMFLRTSSIPKYYLSVPYTIMGGVLLLGSVQFYRQYLLVTNQQKFGSG